MAPPPSKKRRTGATATRTEEITFNPDARHEYLTGFHKRKVQRTKHAQEAAERRLKEERREQRKKLREERKAELEEAVESHQLQMKIAAGDVVGVGGDVDGEKDDEEGDGWDGIKELPPVDYEAEYIDEDKYTTVTVEDMDPSRNGLEGKEEDSGSGSENEEGSGKEENGEGDDEDGKSTDGANSTKKKRIWAKENPNGDIKRRRRKRNFKYESAVDRKAGRLKQRQKNSKQAKLRREQ